MTIRRSAVPLVAAALLFPAIATSAVTAAKGDNPDRGVSSAVTRQFTAEGRLSDGTPSSITIIASSSEEGNARAAISQAATRIAALDNELFSAGGIGEQLNSLAAGHPLKLTEDAFGLIARAVELSALTNGWYDVAAPSPKNFFVQRDWRRVSMNPAERTVAFKSDGMRLDLKRISPGFMADLALDAIERAGFANAMVRVGTVQRNIGRDIFTPWSIQIGLGGRSDKLAHRAFNYNISNVASATVTAENLGAGLIDSHSKRPVLNDLAQSTTVIAASAATATAYAIAAYTLGPRTGLRFVEAHPEVKAIIVDTDGNLLASAGLRASSPTVLIDSQRTAPYDGGSNDLRQKEIEEERDR